jgi:hypothetical protein
MLENTLAIRSVSRNLVHVVVANCVVQVLLPSRFFEPRTCISCDTELLLPVSSASAYSHAASVCCYITFTVVAVGSEHPQVLLALHVTHPMHIANTNAAAIATTATATTQTTVLQV